MNRSHFWHALTHSLSVVFFLFPVWTGIDKNGNVSLQETPHKVVYVIAWSPDGSMIAVGNGSDPCGPSEIQILDAQTQAVINTLPGGGCLWYSFDWSPDGTKIAVTTLGDIGIRVWDVKTGQLAMAGQGPTQGYVYVKWHPDGEKIVVTDIGGGAYILDSATGELLNALNFTGSGIDWSPDGNRLVTASGILQENKV